MTRINAPEVKAFQQEQLRLLMQRPYAELQVLKADVRIKSPPHIRGLEFWVARRTGESGGVQVEVRACKRHLLVFLASHGVEFEMLADGRVLSPGATLPGD